MAKNHSKNCPRCGTTFECRPEDISNCQCAGVRLSAATRQYLSGTRYDCLCANCLEELDQLVEKAQLHTFPRRPSELVEGLHYYKENGLWVFTEFYHLLRGYCCGSECRHCAYGIHSR